MAHSLSTTQYQKPAPKFTSVDGLRTLLMETYGFTYSKSRLYKLTMNNEIPHIKGHGGRVLFPLADIFKWVEGGVDAQDNGVKKKDGAK